MQAETMESFRVEHQAGTDLRVFDPALGKHGLNIEAPGKGDRIDAVFYDILTSQAGLRALGINQLSKSPVEETYEGSHKFKRWQHVAGVYQVVRHFGRQYEDRYTDDQILQYALVACLPDFGHGVKSHVTDMLKEGMGGNEDFHDTRTGQLIDLGELQEILDKHNVESPFNENGRLAIEVPPWVECPAPDLNVDRLHYVNAEASLMFPDEEVIKDAIRLDNIAITDEGKFAFKDLDQARVWAKAANLCSSEHWNEPTNRLIEMLSLEGMKRTIGKRYLENVNTFDNGYVGSPEDYTFLIDQDFDEALEREALSQRPDIFMNAVYSLIQSISNHERQRFSKHKNPAYRQFLADPNAREYPNQLVNPHRAAFGTPPAQVEILPHENAGVTPEIRSLAAPLKLRDGKVVGVLKQLKFRQFDPLVIINSETVTKPLSEVDITFKKLLDENGQALTYMGAAALHANPESEAALIDGVTENAHFMKKAKTFAPLSPDQIRGIINSSGNRALELARRQGFWKDY